MRQSDCRVDGKNRRKLDTRALNEAITRVANRQGGVVSRAQLQDVGLDRAGIDYRLKIRALRQIHRGVYAVGHDAIPVRGRLCAALLVAGPGSALSHRTAAHVLALLPSMPPFVEVTTTGHRRSNRRGLVFHHTAQLETTRRHQLAVTSPIRTLLDLAATRPLHEVERAASEALVLKLVSERQLRAQRGAGAALLARLIVGPTRSRLERVFLEAVVRAGLPAPLVSHRIGPYTVDFLWPSHDLVVETDGDAYHGHALARHRDRARDEYLARRGFTVLRVPQDELAGAPARVARVLNRPASRTAS